MKRLSRNLIVALAFFFWACDDVLEEDISNDVISIIAPSDGLVVEGNMVQLRWNELEGADEYRVQIMAKNQFIVLDSLVGQNIFNYQIDSGEYTWRVRGENFAYVSLFSFESAFSIVASLDLTNQIITLESPKDKTYLNNEEIDFSWQVISTADMYEFEIFSLDGANEVSIFKEESLTTTSISIPSGTITKDSEYRWRVSASNSNSATKPFQRKFFLDTIDPPAPALNTPTADQVFTTTTEVNFTWTFTDTGSVQSNITGTLEVSTDESFTTVTLTETNSDGEFTNTFETPDTYYWRVVGTDAASNVGANSAIGSFIVN